MEMTIALSAAAVGVCLVVAARMIRSRQDGGGVGDLASRLAAQSEALARIAGAMEERRALDAQAIGSVRSIQALLSGSYSRGQMGENLLAAILSELPSEMVVRDLRISGRVCEFALRMVDGKLLPVDSKWSGFELASPDGAVDASAARAVEAKVIERIAEVAGYIDHSVTVPMAVIALPDNVYACLRKAHEHARRRRVVLVSYSLAVPVLLSQWQMYRVYAQEPEPAVLMENLHAVGVALEEVAQRIDTQLARGLTMATNAVGEIKQSVASARTALRPLAASKSEPQAEPGPNARAV